LEKEGGVGKFRKISIPILKCIFLMNNQHEQAR
jgi:hypothetical protein